MISHYPIFSMILVFSMKLSLLQAPLRVIPTWLIIHFSSLLSSVALSTLHKFIPFRHRYLFLLFCVCFLLGWLDFFVVVVCWVFFGLFVYLFTWSFIYVVPLQSLFREPCSFNVILVKKAYTRAVLSFII